MSLAFISVSILSTEVLFKGTLGSTDGPVPPIVSNRKGYAANLNVGRYRVMGDVLQTLRYLQLRLLNLCSSIAR